MKTALITGANKGIGFEVARQLLRKGFYVYVGSRDLAKGLEAVGRLQAEGLTHVEAVNLDVTNADSISAVRDEIGKRNAVLDVLINNAGINGGAHPYTVASATPDQYQAAFSTNVIGTASVTNFFLDLLLNAPEPRIVNVSTSVGSLTLQSNPNWPAYDFAKYVVYATSKAALNMYTVHLAYELKDTKVKVNVVCPGLTATDFTFFNGGEVSVAAERIIKYALIGPDGPTGKFFSEETNPDTCEIPW